MHGAIMRIHCFSYTDCCKCCRTVKSKYLVPIYNIIYLSTIQHVSIVVLYKDRAIHGIGKVVKTGSMEGS